jgi:serine/threonine-protein kinase RIO1
VDNTAYTVYASARHSPKIAGFGRIPLNPAIFGYAGTLSEIKKRLFNRLSHKIADGVIQNIIDNAKRLNHQVEIVSNVKSGKEATVYRAKLDGKLVAMKLYKCFILIMQSLWNF